MQGGNATINLPNTSTTSKVAADVKADDDPNLSTDLSNSFGTVASKLKFHGLAETQSQGLDESYYLPEETENQDKSSEETPVPDYGAKTAKQNGLFKPKSSSGSILIEHNNNKQQTTKKSAGSTNLPSLENGHVTSHVTDASPPHGVTPIVGPAVDVEKAAAGPPTNQEQTKEQGHKRLLQRNKASSFHVRPEEPSSPRPLKRINTMPPRLNRYAPRDIEPSSQDSFAGSPPRQDLNTFIKNSKVFNNLHIRPGVDGKPSEVFELPSTDSSEMPPVKESKATRTVAEKGKAKRVEPQQAEEEDQSPSQLMQAALAHGLVQRSPTPPSVLLPPPVVLVKGTQSDRHPSEDDSSGSKRYGQNGSGDDMDIQSEGQNESQATDDSPTQSSSSFVLPNIPGMEKSESPQSTQPNTQPIPPDMIIISPNNATLVSAASGISSIPIPEYRRQEFAFLQNRFRNEIVPATPISTVPEHSITAPSVGALAVPPNIQITENVDPSNNKKEKEKAQDAGAMPVRQERTKPASKPQSLRRSERAKPGPLSKDGRRPQGPQEITNEIVPDSQEEQNSNMSVKIIPDPKSKSKQAARDELVVPDSQEEEQKQQKTLINPLSSPSIPLAELVPRPIRQLSSSPPVPLLQTTSLRVPSRFPTPTPAAVKSPLRKGQLPEGVTHTRGRGRPSTKNTETAQVVVEKEEGGGREGDEDQGSDGMEVDVAVEGDEEEDEEEEEETEKEPPRKKYSTKKRTRGTNSKPIKREGRSKNVQKTRRAGPAVTRKRKSDPKLVEQQPSDTSLPPSKRHRSSNTTPGPSVGITQLSKRVLARRQQDSDYYYPSTAHLEFVSSDPTSGSGPFTVEFDDGSEELIGLDDIRSFQLEPGDMIDVTKSKKGASRYRRATVLDVDRWEDEIAQVHDVESGPDGDDYDVNGKDIRVSVEQIQLQWSERCINLRTLCKDKEYELPRRNRNLAGYAFIVTMPDLHESKRSIQRIIELSGGIVCDWSAVVSLSGTSELDGKRIVGKASDVRLVKSKVKLKNLFCVADEPKTTPKFLIALALGVPCLSIDWILAKVYDHEVQFDWQAYILPAGTNPVTKQAASQNFDRVWWRDSDNFGQLLSNSPVEKLFAGKSFLCIGPLFIPKSKEFGTFPKVLLAMGASVVQAVTQLKYVKGQTKFDYTVVDDDGAEVLSYNGAPGVNISWIKKCLITGIEGPVPWPDT
ncbi:hypothetical protein Clacol_010374 [Clathrus columnatus]|uniref:BRCT domain-containing protein n=1 Tax=Clathrus columnatus TaxID=1419009 RepID=A0AAV5ANN6_9AGAM|nr:hypothetical protein Clacol_010374 [Clathrus columnatus]